MPEGVRPPVTRLLTAAAILVLGMMLSLPAVAQEAEEAFDFPVRAFNDGNYEVAVRGFQEFIDEFPDHEWAVEARYWKAESLLHLGRHREALNELLTVIKEDPGFAHGDVAERLAYAADESGLREILGPNLSLRLLHEHPSLQNYVISWFYEQEPDRVLARLRSVDSEHRTEEAQRLLDESEMDENVQQLVSDLEDGNWNRRLRDDLDSLSFELRDNVLALVAKRLWDRGNLDLIKTFGRELPPQWMGMDFSIYVAEAAIETREWELAWNVYQRLLDQLDFRPPEVAYGLAWIEYQQGRLEQAKQRLNPIAWERLSGELGHQGLRLQGDIAYDQGDYEWARDRYSRVLDRDLPEDVELETRYWLGWTHLNLDQPAPALDQFRQLEGSGVVSRERYLEAHGIAAQQMGEWEEAEQKLEQALGSVSQPEESASLRYRLARVKFEQQQFEESQSILTDLRQESIDGELDRSVALALANLHYEQGNPEQVRRLLEKEPQLRETHPERYYALSAWSYRETGQVVDAAQSYRTLVRQYPDSSEAQPALQALFNLALEHPDVLGFEEQTLRDLIDRAAPQRSAFMLRDWARFHEDEGNTSRYRSLYRELLDREAPRALHAEAYSSLVESHLREDDFDTAERLLRESDELEPHPILTGAFYRYLKTAYDRRDFERLAEVGDLFEDRFDPTDTPAELLFMMGELERHESRYEAAREHYERVLDRDPQPELRDQALYRLAEAAYRTDQIEQGNEYLDRMEDPERLGGGEAVYYRIANLRFQGGRTEEALAAAERLPEEPSYELLRGKILLQNGEAERALETIEAVDPGEERTSLHPERLFWLARAHEELGDLETAEEYLYEVRYRYPDWDQMDRLYDRLITVLEQLDRPEEIRRLEEQRTREQS